MSLLAQSSNAIQSSGKSGNLIYDVVELVLDRGLVIDVFARVALVGIEIVTIDARVVVASIDTYLQFAEACGRLDLSSPKPAGALERMGSAIGNTVQGLIGTK
jgi:gas vesicle structural protein